MSIEGYFRNGASYLFRFLPIFCLNENFFLTPIWYFFYFLSSNYIFPKKSKNATVACVDFQKYIERQESKLYLTETMAEKDFLVLGFEPASYQPSYSPLYLAPS